MLDIHSSQIELDQLLGEEELPPTRRAFLRELQCRVSDYLDPDFPQTQSLQELVYDLAFVLRNSDSEASAKEMARTSLTEKESQLLSRLDRGEPIREIAAALFVSEATIKSHLGSLYRKLDARNRVEAIDRAKRSGLL
jgi:DNA-binding NarL/FixJ family response regulator